MRTDVAYSYAESAEDVDESWLDQIVVFACDIKDFDLKRLFVDANVVDNDGVTLEYHGIMPYRKLMQINAQFFQQTQPSHMLTTPIRSGQPPLGNSMPMQD